MKLLPQIEKKKMPELIPYDFTSMQSNAIGADKGYYNRSDNDAKVRNPELIAAEGGLKTQLMKDWQGEHELMPQLQSEFVNAGLLKSMGAFGDTPGVLAPGSAGEANVAKNLGISIMGFQDRNRQNRENSLKIAEELFPRRTFGMSGESRAMLDMLNTSNKNELAQKQFANDTLTDQFNYRVDAANTNAETTQANNEAQAAAAKKAAMWKAISGGVQTLTSTAGSFCWVARAVYGANDPRWLQFRHWMLTRAPQAILDFYAKHGPGIAAEVEQNEDLRGEFRAAMDAII